MQSETSHQPKQESASTGTPTSYVYGSAAADWYLLQCPKTLPLYGHLARKLIAHYLGERYNPHEHGIDHEPFLRQRIKAIVEYKVLYRRSGYDWRWIDHAFSKYFSAAFDLNLPWDQSVIDAGFAGGLKADFLIDMSQVH